MDDPYGSVYLHEGMYEGAIRFLEDRMSQHGGEVDLIAMYDENDMEGAYSTLDISEDNVEFSDELLEFIYEKGKRLSFSTDKLTNINPYTDTVILLSDLPKIIEICRYFLAQGTLQNSRNPNEWSQMINELIEIAQKAMYRGLGLISIGD